MTGATAQTPFDEFLAALLDGDRRRAVDVVARELDGEAGFLAIYSDLVQPAMYEIGRLWETNCISVAHEHAATATAEHVLSMVYAHIPVPDRVRGRAVVLAPSGELHQVGPRIVADALESDGWDVRFLGVDVPDEAAVAAVVEHDPALVGISATLPTRMPQVAELVRRLRFVAQSGLSILVGGHAFAGDAAWRAVDADGCAHDVRGAVDAARAAVAG